MPEFPDFKKCPKNITSQTRVHIKLKEQILISWYSWKGHIIKRAKWAAATAPPNIGIGAACLTHPNIIRIYQ